MISFSNFKIRFINVLSIILVSDVLLLDTASAFISNPGSSAIRIRTSSSSTTSASSSSSLPFRNFNLVRTRSIHRANLHLGHTNTNSRNNVYDNSRTRTRVYSTKEVDADAIEPVFEDVDGIGELTNTIVEDVAVSAAVSVTPTAAVVNVPDDVGIAGSSTGNKNTINDAVAASELMESVVMDAVYGNSNIGTNDTVQVQHLIDPAAVVEAVIGTALSDADANKMIPTHNLLDVEPKSKDLDVEVEEEIEVPNLRKIAKFAIPAVGVWLCSPLLSLIDTSSVGLLSGTVQQAALNPAVAVTDYGALLVAFMYTATTNLVAGARGKEASSNDKTLTKKTLITALQLSAYVGMTLGSALVILAPILLKSIIGNDQIDPRVFAAALRYVRIRALGMPAAVVIGSAQSACIGMQDVRSPMYVLVAAALVNLLGDIIFVPQKSAWMGGAAGAAWATVFSQYAALVLFYKWMTARPKQEPINLTKAILELTGKSDEGKTRRKRFRRALMKISTSNSTFKSKSTTKTDEQEEIQNNNVSEPRKPLGKRIKTIFRKKKTAKKASSDEESFSVKGFLATERKEMMTPPRMEDAKVFWPYFIPVTTTSVGRISAYISMSHVVSSSLGTLSMAANQIVLSVFYCLTPIADSLNLTAQSFVPAIAQRKRSVARAKAIRQTTINFMKSSLLFSVGMVGAVSCLPLVSKYFTSDPAVITLVNSIVPVLSLIFGTHGLVCALEGVILGQKDLNFLGKSYASFFFIVPYFMLRVKKAALQGVQDAGLTSLWSVFLAYNVVRAVMWTVRAKMLSDNAMKKVDVKE